MEKTTGAVIKFLRKRDGLSQEDLGKHLGVKRVTIQKYESNTIALRIDTIKALSLLFHVSPWILVFPESLTSEHYQQLKEERMESFFLLNDAGRDKALDYISDLAEIERYRL